MDIITFTNVSNITLGEFINQFYVAKATIYKLFQNKLITVNDLEVKSEYKLKKVDIIKIDIEVFEENDIKPWDYPLNIIHEDKDILIINKPIGILVHPDGKDEHTIANAVSFYYQTKGMKRQIRHIHRLDFDTSGILVFAKHLFAHSFLNYLVENKQFKKTYLAIIYGKMEEKEGVINLNIGRDRHISNKYLVSKSGKEAITKYKTLEYFNGRSLVEILLETGRTHQIRVHFSHLKHPLVGDKIYSTLPTKERLMLHAFQVSFIHPRSRNLVTYEAKMPKDFKLKG